MGLRIKKISTIGFLKVHDCVKRKRATPRRGSNEQQNKEKQMARTQKFLKQLIVF